MKNIRRGVFETNSSSSHSISIANSDGVLDTIMPDEHGNIVLTGGEFGWAWERINDSLTKANYCAVDVQNNPDKLRMLRDVIMDHTGCSDVIFQIEGYIDHESVGNSSEAFVSYATLKNCIFNPDSYIFTGNDNGREPPNFYDVGREFHYKYRLEMDDTNMVELFENQPNKDDIEDSIDRIIERHDFNKYADQNQNYNFYDDDDDDKDPPEENFWSFVPYIDTDYKGNKFGSLTRMEQGVILLFKLQDVYAEVNHDNPDWHGEHLGRKVVTIKEVNFRIVEL